MNRAAIEPSSEAPVRLAVLFSGNGFHSKEWWAKGEGSEMELGKVLAPLQDFREKMLFIRGLYNEEALKGNIHSSQTGNLLSGAPLASGGEIRSGTSIDQLLAQRVRQLDEGAEPGARLREVEPVGPQELLDALQLAHLVELADHADAAGALSRARVRPAVQGRGEQGRQERARRRARRRRQICAAASARTDQRKLDEYLDSVRDVEQRIENAGKARRVAGLAADARQAEHPAPGRRHPAGHRRAHAADVRHPGARLPDRHHADQHAQAQQRPLARCASRTSASIT